MPNLSFKPSAESNTLACQHTKLKHIPQPQEWIIGTLVEIPLLLIGCRVFKLDYYNRYFIAVMVKKLSLSIVSKCNSGKLIMSLGLWKIKINKYSINWTVRLKNNKWNSKEGESFFIIILIFTYNQMPKKYIEHQCWLQADNNTSKNVINRLSCV